MNSQPKGFIDKIRVRIPGLRPPLTKLAGELQGYILGIEATVEEDRAEMIKHELEAYRLQQKILSDRERQIRYGAELERLGYRA